MKKRLQSLLSLVLAMMMVFASLPVSAATDITYTVVFDGNGADNPNAMSESSMTMTNDQEEYLSENLFERRGYYFDGWARTPDGTAEFVNTEPVSSLTTTDGEVITLYATWYELPKATMTYASADTAMGTVSPENEILYENEYEAFGSTATANEGYSFVKWTLDDEDYTDEVKVVPLPNYTSGEPLWVDRLYTAYFTPNTYTVAFDANGGEGDMANMNFNYGTAQNLTANTFTKLGSNFAGWAITPDGAVTYADGEQVNNLTAVNGDTVTLYAIWTDKANVTITYTAGANGTVSTTSEALNPDTGVAYGSTATANEGYHFVNWTDEGAEASTDEIFVPIMPATGWTDVTYTANFAPNTYTVAFNTNGGEGDMADMSFTYDAAQNLTANTFTKLGSVFAGWAITPDGAVTYVDGEQVNNLTAVNGDTVTLYAIWTDKANVTITYTAGENGAVSTTSEALNPDVGYAYGSTATANEGYHFVNWTDADSEVSTDATFVPTKPTTGWTDVTYTANFAPNTYTVAFNANGGEGDMADMSFTYDAAQNLTANTFTKLGSVFAGWAITPDGTAVYTDGEQVTNLTSTDGDTVTLYAVWEVKPTAIVTFKVVNGTWEDETTDDIKVTVILTDGKGTLGIDNIPENMIANQGYIASGRWDNEPEYGENMITGDVTYTYTFRKSRVPAITGIVNLITDRELLNKEKHIKYFNGYPDNTFRPDDEMTRAEAAQMFYNLLKDPENVETTKEFTDVTDDMWHYTAVGKLTSLGIINGEENGTFRPEDSITRGEFIAAAMRFTEGEVDGKNIFSDVKKTDWYYDYIIGAVNLGWIEGYEDGTFRPEATITRAEVATIINRMLNRIPDQGFIRRNVNSMKTFADASTDHWAYYDIMEAINSHHYDDLRDTENWTELM